MIVKLPFVAECIDARGTRRTCFMETETDLPEADASEFEPLYALNLGGWTMRGFTFAGSAWQSAVEPARRVNANSISSEAAYDASDPAHRELLRSMAWAERTFPTQDRKALLRPAGVPSSRADEARESYAAWARENLLWAGGRHLLRRSRFPTFALWVTGSHRFRLRRGMGPMTAACTTRPGVSSRCFRPGIHYLPWENPPAHDPSLFGASALAEAWTSLGFANPREAPRRLLSPEEAVDFEFETHGPLLIRRDLAASHAPEADEIALRSVLGVGRHLRETSRPNAMKPGGGRDAAEVLHLAFEGEEALGRHALAERVAAALAMLPRGECDLTDYFVEAALERFARRDIALPFAP